MPTPRTDQLDLGADGLERKGLELKVTDEDQGLVEAVFSTYNVIDKDGDILVGPPIVETLPFEDGAEVRISAYGHRSWWGELPIGRGKIRAEKDRAILEGQFFLNTTGGKETFEVIRQMGNLQEYSYSLMDITTMLVDDLPEDLQGAARAITKVKVHEVSPVLVGASIGTHTLDVKGAKRAIASHSTATTDDAWSAGTNVGRISNDATASTLRKMYAWVDPDGDPDAKSSYKFPHHMVSADGAIGAASTRACSAGIAVLNGGRGGSNIPDGDRRGVWNHLARHLRDADMEPPELRSAEDTVKADQAHDAVRRELIKFERTRARLLLHI